MVSVILSPMLWLVLGSAVAVVVLKVAIGTLMRRVSAVLAWIDAP
jgi:hypothetical protein